MKKTLTLAGALTLAALLTACGQKADETEATAPAASAAAAEQASAPASVPKEGEVIVAPVSKVASAPGIDPMDASTLPPMPKNLKPVMLDKDGKPVAITDAAASAPANKK